jgi:glycosyltransferase involved in cell wall biosynthesis
VITFFTSYLGGKHGTAKSARDFIRALLANEDEVTIVAPNQEAYPDSLGEKKLSTPRWKKMPGVTNFPHSLKDFRQVKPWLGDQIAKQKLRTDETVIVNGWASIDDWNRYKDQFSGNKIMIVRESPRQFDGPDRDQHFHNLLGGFSSFDYLIFVSDIVRSEWCSYPQISTIPSFYFPNCCEEEEAVVFHSQDRFDLRKQYGYGPDDFLILCPGTIEYRKGQDLLLQIIPELQKQISNLKVLVVGDAVTVWGEELLKNIPADLRDRTVSIMKSKDSIFDLLHIADVLAFPSRAEALPRTILEAMVMKTPIVASDVDGIPELIVDNQTGLLFPSGNSEELYKELIYMYKQPELRSTYSEAGSERYWVNFSRKNQFERMKHLINHIKESV